MNAFSPIFAKIISALVSVLCVFNFTIPTNFQSPKPTRMRTKTMAVSTIKEDENQKSGTELVIDETPDTPNPSGENTPDENKEVKTEEKNDEQNPVDPADDANKNTGIDEESIMQARAENNDTENNGTEPVEENEYNDFEVLETFDISATEDDDVTLTICAAPKRAMAMNAPAALSEDETTVSDNKATVSFNEDDIGTVDDDGNTQKYITAIVSGDGDMEDNVYRYFVDIDKYIEISRLTLADKYGLEFEDVIYTLPEGVTDFLEVDMQIKYYAGKDCAAGPAGTLLEITDDCRAALDPMDMLKYSPNNIVFDGNVTSISEGAFLCCDELTEIEIPGTVKTIGDNAFAFCLNLSTVILNEGLERIEPRAFMQCKSLDTITLPSTVNYIGDEAFAFMGYESRIICPTNDVYNLANVRGVITPDRTVVECI